MAALQAPWPQGDEDTDEYRMNRALETFNLALPVCHDLKELKPTGITWVPHILLFIVPRQMVSLGDPSRRSCDACESFGAMVKKIIKHATLLAAAASDRYVTALCARASLALTPTLHSCPSPPVCLSVCVQLSTPVTSLLAGI